MDSKITKILAEKPASQLIKIIEAALQVMSETVQIDFIARYIDAQTSLTRLGADDPEAFIEEVEKFCLDCLNGNYYSSEDDIETYFMDNAYQNGYYDDDWDYDEYYSTTEWVGIFEKLLKLAIIYMQSEDYETGYEASSRLLSCLEEMMSDSGFLGTNEPVSYINLNWNEFFALYYPTLFKCCPDTDNAIKIAFRRWTFFGSVCEEGFLNNVKDADAAKRIILDAIKSINDWKRQHKSFVLLTRLYSKWEKKIDVADEAKQLISSNEYFYFFYVEGLVKDGRFQEAVEAAQTALAKILPLDDRTHYYEANTRREIRNAIQSTLTDAYEKLSDFSTAFETILKMFLETPSFEIYKRARVLADKTDSVSQLLKQAESKLIDKDLLINIYSYEGETRKITELMMAQEIGFNYYKRKYAALSLIYRALNSTPDIGSNLAEYLSTAAGQEGITDMLFPGNDVTPQNDLLLQGAGLLRSMITFHIDAANRGRYAKAAYYMCVLRDIFKYLQEEDDFRIYFNDVIQQNKRRPALRDEMGIVYGKGAVAVKK